MSVGGYDAAIRYFKERIAPGMSDSVKSCHTEQASLERVAVLMEAAQDVGGVAVRRIAGAGEQFYAGSMVKRGTAVLFRGVFEPVANWPIPVERQPIKVSLGNIAVAVETMRDAEEDALQQVRSRADEIYPVSRDLEHLLA